MNDDRKRKEFEKPPEELKEFDNIISSPPEVFRKAEESERFEVMSPLKPKKP